jgi:hypothetical protein
MPMKVTKTAGGTNYGFPFVGPMDHPLHVKLDVSGLTTDEVDSEGYLKPGVPLTSAGILVASGAVYGVTIEAVKIADDNTALAGDTSDPLVAIGTIGVVNRDVVEDNLGRALTSAEIAGFSAAGSKLVLTTT